MTQPAFIIRMPSGFFYSSFEHGRVIVCHRQEDAAQFGSRFAALGACTQSPDFAGATIVPFEAEAIQ